MPHSRNAIGWHQFSFFQGCGCFFPSGPPTKNTKNRASLGINIGVRHYDDDELNLWCLHSLTHQCAQWSTCLIWRTTVQQRSEQQPRRKTTTTPTDPKWNIFWRVIFQYQLSPTTIQNYFFADKIQPSLVAFVVDDV
jgi:hypothetical protein